MAECRQRLAGSLWESPLVFHSVNPKDQTEVVMVDCRLRLPDPRFSGFSPTAQSCPLCLRSAQGTFRPEAQTTGPKGPSAYRAGPCAPADAHCFPRGWADLPPGCQLKDLSGSMWVSFSLNCSLHSCASGGATGGVLSGSPKLYKSWKDRLWPSGS